MDEEDAQKSKLALVLWRLRRHPDAWPFREPVDVAFAPGYTELITRPMDLLTMTVYFVKRCVPQILRLFSYQKNLHAGKYEDMKMFAADFHLICSNCVEVRFTLKRCLLFPL